MTSEGHRGRAFALTFLFVFGLMLANGRPIGSGDTRAVETTAAALVERSTFILPSEDANDPFTRPVASGRVSIYPALPAVAAVPVFALFRSFFDLTPAGVQAAGKVTAALFAAFASAWMAAIYARRASTRAAVLSGVMFGVGTSVFSTAQALWQHPSLLVGLAVGLGALERTAQLGGQAQRGPAIVAGLALSLAAACRTAAIPMVAVLVFCLLYRVRGHRLAVFAAASIPAVGVAMYNAHFFGSPWTFGASAEGRFMAALPGSIAGLLISPARGLFVFTPLSLLALWALLQAARRGSFGQTLLTGVAVHVVFIACWNEWHGGESFGPRLLTDCLPLLFFFLPEGMGRRPILGVVLGALSVGVQLLGAWTYDYRWERLHQRGSDFDSALWSWRDSPIPFAIDEGVVIQGVPDASGRRFRFRARRFVPFGPEGSTIDASAGKIRVTGSAIVSDVRLERAGRATESGLVLSHPADALAFRALRAGTLALRLTGTTLGTVSVEGASESRSHEANGPFDVVLALRVDAGDDVFVRSPRGDLRITRVETNLGPIS